MGRRLFCQLSPTAYRIFVEKNRMQRRLEDMVTKKAFAKQKGQPLPVTIYRHGLLIRRTLGDVDPRLQ